MLYAVVHEHRYDERVPRGSVLRDPYVGDRSRWRRGASWRGRRLRGGVVSARCGTLRSNLLCCGQGIERRAPSLSATGGCFRPTVVGVPVARAVRPVVAVGIVVVPIVPLVLVGVIVLLELLIVVFLPAALRTMAPREPTISRAVSGLTALVTLLRAVLSFHLRYGG